MARRSQTSEGRRRWRQWSEAEARAALAEFAASGESAARFAHRTGVSSRRLAYWKTRLGTVAAAFVAVQLPSNALVRDTIEICVDGVAVRVREDLDVAHIARLVDALARPARGC